MPVRLALEAHEDTLGRRRCSFKDGEVGAGEVGSDKRGLFLRAGQVAGRIDDGGKRRTFRIGDEIIPRGERLEAWGVDNLVLIG
jgi:hypothetical protein